jgi:anti-sigma regulatory factor (Ser/Thr protein kinase)
MRARWTFPAAPAEVGALRDRVARLAASAGLEPGRIAGLQLAVTEAVTNAVRHAYAGRAAGHVTVELTVGEDDVTVSVSDEGGGLRPRPDSPGLGLGLPLMTRLADELAVVERPGGGTEVRLSFARAA